MTDLAPIIAAVKALHDAGDWTYGQQKVTGQRIARELATRFDARFAVDREPMRMTLAGITASSTGGYVGLFSNWLAAAQRKLADGTP